MKTITAKITGVSPYSQSAPIQSVKETGEGHDAFEERTWRERMHVGDDGYCFIPPGAIKNALSDVAKYLSETVPGKGKATYTKHFEAGIMVASEWPLLVDGKRIKPADVPGERLFVPADGRRGSGKRVWKTFPRFSPWEASGEILVLDPILIDSIDKVEEYLKFAGQFIGIGRFRPRNNGYFGRFSVDVFKID